MMTWNEIGRRVCLVKALGAVGGGVLKEEPGQVGLI